MNDEKWKIGDKVYYFYHYDDCSLLWNLSDFEIQEDEVTKIGINGVPEFSNGYEFYPGQAIFRSKNDAVNAMVKHLNGMRDIIDEIGEDSMWVW